MIRRIAFVLLLCAAGCTKGDSPTAPYCTVVKDRDSAVVGKACWQFP